MSPRSALLAALAAAALAPAAAEAQERTVRTLECRGENACRVHCSGLADVGRVSSVTLEESAWGPETLILTVTHEFGTSTMIVRSQTSCRLDNLVEVQ